MDYSNWKTVYYDDKQENIVKKGYIEIEKVLNGINEEEKLSLLFCLDKYMDPYFNLELPDKDAVYNLLQQVIISKNSLWVKDDAINLLSGYTWGPYEILKDNLDKIEPELIQDVMYLINEKD